MLPEGRLRLARLQQRPVNTREELVTLDILAIESLRRILLEECSNEALRRRKSVNYKFNIFLAPTGALGMQIVSLRSE